LKRHQFIESHMHLDNDHLVWIQVLESIFQLRTKAKVENEDLSAEMFSNNVYTLWKKTTIWDKVFSQATDLLTQLW
jgi:hypothetical protein